MRYKYLILFLGFLNFEVYAQDNNIFIGRSYFSFQNKGDIYNIDTLKSNLHTTFKPVVKQGYNSFALKDSCSTLPKNKKWLFRKFYEEHLIVIKGEDYSVVASPIVNLNFGKDLVNDKKTFTNTRGYIVFGDLGKRVSFFTSFRENQSIFPLYMHEYILKTRVVPGQGYARNFKGKGFDYAMSSGHVIIDASKFFKFQFGHGKHFIGEGYRSLLLSDNTFNYPYLRIQTDFWKVQYTNLYAELQDINYFASNGIDNYDQMGYAKKYMSSHYLSLNLTNKLNVSLFETVIWRMNHAPGVTGFDINYLNPIILLRPVEFSINSPDNMLVGLNLKYLLKDNMSLYGQVILDEFSLEDLRKQNDFWGNKFGYQIGFKNNHIIGTSRLANLIEYNYVRPYTYAHHNPQQNYAHYNQPLSHPLGANFSELIFMNKYRFKKWELTTKILLMKYGADFSNDTISYGNDLFQSTGNFQQPNGNIQYGRPSDYGVAMYQGNLTNVLFKEFNISYIINHRTNFKLNLGVIQRDLENDDGKKSTTFFNFGIKSDLFNQYYDF